MEKKIHLTGIKPTGAPHWGNYLGAIKPAIDFVANSDSANVEAYYFIADLHSLTGSVDQKTLKHQTYEVTATWLACGLDPSKAAIFRQSAIPEIPSLSWMLSCVTPKGMMNRAHAYKAKVAENEKKREKDPDAGVNLGLYSYPVLMAADILAFSSHSVPVGEDQLQHVEYARDLAERFNHRYGNVLTVPQPSIQKGMLIPGTDGQKMSKSYNNAIPLFVPEKKLRKSVMGIKTDSTPPEAPKKPDDSLVFDLFQKFASKEESAALRAHYEKGISWGEAKQTLFEKVNSVLSPMREEYDRLIANPQEMDQILDEGAARARAKAGPLHAKVREALGIVGSWRT